MSTGEHTPIGGRYAMYKEGGERITRWLVSTATACRRSLTARSTARGKVSTKELLTYAEAVASWKPPVEIPANITELLHDVVKGREVCAAFYESQNMACAGHQHMIEVLQDILAVLLAARLKRRKEKGKGKPAPVIREDSKKVQNPVEALNNLFENLQVEEPSNEAWNVAPKKQKGQPPPPVAKPTLEVDEKEEKMFALFCFLKDMQEMRDFVKNTWQEYIEKKMAVVTASMVTEAALGIMSCVNETLIESYPGFAQIEGVLEFLDLQLRTDPGGRPGLYAGSGEQVDNELVQMLCPEAVALVSALQTLFKSANFDARKRKAAGGSTWEQWRWHEAATPPKAFSTSSFGTLLYNLFPDLFRLVNEHKSCTGFSHEFLRGLVQVAVDKQASLWFISAVQIYHDVQEQTQGGRTPFYQYCIMHTHSHKVLSELQRLQKDRVAQYTGLQTCSGRCFAEEVKMAIEQAVLGNIAALKYEQNAYQQTLMANENWMPAAVWKAFPAWSGEMINRFSGWQSEYNHTIANDGSIILAFAYLYKACRHTDLLPQAWKDMEWLLEQVGQERPLIQEVGPSGNMATFSRRLYLATGGSAASLSRDTGRDEVRDARSSKQAYQQRRTFRLGSEFHQLAEDLSIDGRYSSLPKRWSVQTALQKVMAKRMQDKSGRAQKQSQQKLAFTGLEMLKFFKQQRLEDEPVLQFDLVSFFMACKRMLWDVRVQWQGENAALKPRWDYLVVDDVFHDAHDAEADGKPLASSAIGDAAGILEQYISKHGSRYSDEASALARGEIPEAWVEEVDTLNRGQVPAKWSAMLDPSWNEVRSASKGSVLDSEISCTCDKEVETEAHQAKVEEADEDEDL